MVTGAALAHLLAGMEIKELPPLIAGVKHAETVGALVWEMSIALSGAVQ